MKAFNFKREIELSVADAVERVTEKLAEKGFGVLTRIDLHTKFKEKLGKDVSPVVILGACNPNLAFEAFQLNPDVTSLLPCNVVVREVGNNRVSIEVAKPSEMMNALGDDRLVSLAKDADKTLQGILERL